METSVKLDTQFPPFSRKNEIPLAKPPVREHSVFLQHVVVVVLLHNSKEGAPALKVVTI